MTELESTGAKSEASFRGIQELIRAGSCGS